ncbi:hypothetical protein O0235_06310 [Tepidiforma flava]|uniref:Methyl-accepting transducer domain-containing protein n=1 Tax=Tepidiforma flava TaxID=3004094 RepID=A0ABY7M9G5_9CHLR|nr:hypothetical protein [Tepidiforma flava]WBL37176.1 hypothetical protein O0235_06310 [Tepidiforma flava]
MQQGTQEAVEAMAAGVRDVEAGRGITSEAGRGLARFDHRLGAGVGRADGADCGGDVQGLASGAERIVASAEQIATMAGESAEGATSMAAATSRVTATPNHPGLGNERGDERVGGGGVGLDGGALGAGAGAGGDGEPDAGAWPRR